MRHGSSDGRGGSAERPPGAATSHDRRSATARGLSTASQDPDGAAGRSPVDPGRRPQWSAGMTRRSVWPRLPTAAGQRGWGRRIGRPYRKGSIRFPTARATGAWACAERDRPPGFRPVGSGAATADRRLAGRRRAGPGRPVPRQGPAAGSLRSGALRIRAGPRAALPGRPGRRGGRRPATRRPVALAAGALCAPVPFCCVPDGSRRRRHCP